MLHCLHAAPRFALPPGTTWEGGVTGFAIRGPYNSANMLKARHLSRFSLLSHQAL
jgi:hypothetical protein